MICPRFFDLTNVLEMEIKIRMIRRCQPFPGSDLSGTFAPVQRGRPNIREINVESSREYAMQTSTQNTTTLHKTTDLWETQVQLWVVFVGAFWYFKVSFSLHTPPHSCIRWLWQRVPVPRAFGWVLAISKAVGTSRRLLQVQNGEAASSLGCLRSPKPHVQHEMYNNKHSKVITSYSTTMGNYPELPAPTSFPRIHLTHNMIIYIIIYHM